MAKYVSLFLNDGKFNGKQIVSKEWIDLVNKEKKEYAMLTWRNHESRAAAGLCG